MDNESSADNSDDEAINQGSVNIASDVNNKPQHLNILSAKSAKINEKFIINFTKENFKNIDQESKRTCKVAALSSDFNITELQSILSNLNPEVFQNIFTFIINFKNVGFFKSPQNPESPKIKNKFVKNAEKLKKSLCKFSEARPLILQLTSEDENVTKIYYKWSNSSKFICINQHDKNFQKCQNFPTFLCAFLNGSENIENLVAENLSQIKTSSIILRFLRIFQFSQEYFNKLIIASAAFGSKNDLLAAIDAQFDGDGRVLSIESQKYLKEMIIEDQNLKEDEEFLQNDEDQTIDDNLSSSASQQPSNNSDLSSISSNSHMNPSVLLSAIQNSNKSIIDYLINHCTHLIQELPFKHEVRVSTAALNTNQLDVLCDLLDISDFPFPENFKIDSVEDDKLLKIIDHRMRLQVAIETESMKSISKFIDQHLSLRVVFSPTNKSALKIAADSNKFKVFYHLVSNGFRAVEFDDIEEIISKAVLKDAIIARIQQRRKNVKNALEDELSSVNLLCTRSFIHDRRITNEQEAKYRQTIRKWYEDINKIEFGWELLDVAASCENLKIVFDFESKSVENVSLSSPYVLGSMYPSTKWIFVGAKLSDHKRSQQIKGVLAHELCHFVMMLVYENIENPYYKHKTTLIRKFEAIVKAIDKWSAEDFENPDDECNGIISSVFRCYDVKDFHPELIVRVMQILAEFDDDEDTTKFLKDKYEELFEFFRIHVLPDLEIFDLKLRESVRRFNRISELLPNISSQEIQFSALEDMKQLLDNQVMILTTNVPKLLFINIFKYLKDEYGEMLDTTNIFIDSEKLKNPEICEEYENLMIKYPKIHVYVDLSKSNVDDLKDIMVGKESNFIFVVSSQEQQDDLLHKLTNFKITPKSISIIYKFDQLTADSQKMLLQKKINFQNNLQYSFYDLLDKTMKIEDNESLNCDQDVLSSFSEIIDDQILNELLNSHQISINSEFEVEKYFEFLYQPRKLSRKIQDPKNENLPKYNVMPQFEFLRNIEDNKYVLISDKAGNGKSWAMKNFTKVLREQYPTRWVTYVDLKQFIKQFKTQQGTPEFSTFMAEKILKLKYKFESKIFKRLYNDGKVFILFDGFDEIAPDCAEFVSILAQTFEFNGGNQLWIATRDYFEVDLKQKLQVKSVYTLFDHDYDNVEQIVKLWLLDDFEKQDKVTDINEFIKNSQNVANYRKLANKVDEKMSMKKYSIYVLGGPQINKMVADISKNDKTAVLDLRQFQIFEKFVYCYYERWAYNKGQLRKMANIESQKLELNFWKIHQYKAVKQFFPNYSGRFFPDYDGSEWSEEEIIACGFMAKIHDFLYFSHQTFGEFFIADLILKHLKASAEDGTITFIFKNMFNRGPNECIVFMFVDVLVNEFGSHTVTMMLINEGIENATILDGMKPKMSFFMQKIYSMRYFHEYFTKNIDKLAGFVIDILKNGRYEKVKEMLSKSVEEIVKDTENFDVYSKFRDFLCEFLKLEDLKALVVEKELLKKILKFNPNVEIIKDFSSKIEALFGVNFVKDRFMSVSKDGSILHTIFKHQNKTQNIMKIIQNYLEITEIIELTKILNKRNENVLHVCAKNGNKSLWIEIEKIYLSQNLEQEFKELAMQEADYGQNILKFLNYCPDLNFHKFFWSFFPKFFNNSEDLMNFVLKISLESNFIHYIVFRSAPIIELTFNILKQNLTKTQYKQVLSTTSGREKKSILQILAYERHLSVEEHKAIWKIVRDSCETDEEFLKIVNINDWDNVNILCHAVHNRSSDVIEFMINELERICSQEQLTKFLCSVDVLGRNLLLLAAMSVKSLNTHIYLWTMFEKYVERSKILEYIHPCWGEYSCNILMCAVYGNKIEVVLFIWSKIKALITKRGEIVEYLKVKNTYGEDIHKWSRRNFDYPKVHKWVNNLLMEYGIIARN